MISRQPIPRQIKAARALLSWTRKDLGNESGMCAETIKNIEYGVSSPKKETLAALVDAFARHGVQFVHYETLTGGPTERASKCSLKVISYVGAVHLTVTAPEIMEEDHD
ncbi:MAG: helix-turn-helix transcriptional regulator [Alphaproteobacteria bacterium]|nr:helix-turn-helix transcriptional regulator [Alphaproteobacteria bacterium]